MSTVTTTSQPATASPLRRLISGHPLVAYFVKHREEVSKKLDQVRQVIERTRPKFEEIQGSHSGGRYSDAALDRWAAWLAERAQGGSPIYAFFNNDTGGHAPRDAVRLRNAIHARTA